MLESQFCFLIQKLSLLHFPSLQKELESFPRMVRELVSPLESLSILPFSHLMRSFSIYHGGDDVSSYLSLESQHPMSRERLRRPSFI